MTDQRIGEFLRRTGMDAGRIDPDAALEEFIRQMRAGLAGRPASLRMLPSFLTVSAAPKNRRVLAIDAGGTNLRTASVRFDAQGRPAIERLERRPMPGRAGALDREGFFAALADALEPFADDGSPAGFCFSFVMDVLPDRDGRIGAFCKELRIRGAEGAVIGASLNRELARRGRRPRRFTLLNDTVAALLAGADGPDTCDGPIGFILGTGTNSCYVENARNLTKLPGRDGSMIVNLESGLYNGFPRGEFDRALDAASEIPGDHPAEKMMGGAYMGELVFRTAQGACRAGLFTERFSAAIEHIGAFTAEQLSAFCAGTPDSALAALTAADPGDAGALRAIIDETYERAARMAAVTLTAIAVHTDTGRSSARPCCVSAEGSSFYGSPLFRPKLLRLLEGWAAGHGRHFRFVRRSDAAILGAAIAAAQQ